MPIVRISSKGQVVIPKQIREKLGIVPGKRVLFRLVGNHAEIVPLPDEPPKAMWGMLMSETSFAEELLKERRKDPLKKGRRRP
ncbi:MAG: AbrB/MazE/SpoVT family DNA-binding domain-containing protein [Syntrophobacteraceae bacterium]